jgi:hypothetical protein
LFKNGRNAVDRYSIILGKTPPKKLPKKRIKKSINKTQEDIKNLFNQVREETRPYRPELRYNISMGYDSSGSSDSCRYETFGSYQDYIVSRSLRSRNLRSRNLGEPF